MIKANEMRVGNLFYPIIRKEPVHLAETGIILKIVELKAFEFSAVFHNEHTAQREQWLIGPYTDAEPIPLTPLLLTQCGLPFKKGFWCNERLTLAKGNSGAFVIIGISGSVSYLHQLQNLYFSLTGEELEINL